MTCLHDNVSRQAINAVETGKHDPSLTLAFALADAFDMTIEQVFDPRGDG
jgi:putative transcriptional regulator